MDQFWTQITQLGLGGSFAVIILWMVFRFVDARRTGMEKVLDSLSTNLKKQTEILDKIYEAQHTNHTAVMVQIASSDTRKEMTGG